jgi:hypothetical protein
MADRGAGVLFPLALLGAGLLFAGGGGAAAVRRPKFHMLMGQPESPFMMPVEIDPERIVVVFSEYRQGSHEGTRVRLAREGHSENIYIAETPHHIFSALGVSPDQFIKVHQPVGTTAPRAGPEWEDEPSMELAPIFVNRAYIEMIGPSSTVHYRRRRLGKLYTTDGVDLELYESLSTLRQIVGPNVPEIQDKWRPLKRNR